MTPDVDRAAAVRAALRALVAEHGFHGASMSAVAKAAGVATGTAYTHYASKDELVVAAYRETKAELGAAATAGLQDDDNPFRHIWLGAYRHLAAHPEHARFLLQVDHSPYRAATRDSLPDDDPMVVAAAGFADQLLPLPLDVIYELSLAPAVRLAAAETSLNDEELDTIAASCWRAISHP